MMSKFSSQNSIRYKIQAHTQDFNFEVKADTQYYLKLKLKPPDETKLKSMIVTKVLQLGWRG